MLSAGDISLRALRQKDTSALSLLANNKNVWINLRDLFPHPYSLADAKKFISAAMKEKPSLTLAIEYEGEACGVIGLVAQTDVYKKSAEIGYWIGEPYWGRGIATIAVRLMTAYGFGRLGLARIYAGVFEYNVASMRVLEKNGYKKEGVFEKAVLKNDRLWDEHRFGKVN